MLIGRYVQRHFFHKAPESGVISLPISQFVFQFQVCLPIYQSPNWEASSFWGLRGSLKCLLAVIWRGSSFMESFQFKSQCAERQKIVNKNLIGNLTRKKKFRASPSIIKM